jgi:hypothetical protein
MARTPAAKKSAGPVISLEKSRFGLRPSGSNEEVVHRVGVHVRAIHWRMERAAAHRIAGLLEEELMNVETTGKLRRAVDDHWRVVVDDRAQPVVYIRMEFARVGFPTEAELQLARRIIDTVVERVGYTELPAHFWWK